ncbi:TPA: hypothetical protein ACUNBO_000669 [Morganella morganii]
MQERAKTEKHGTFIICNQSHDTLEKIYLTHSRNNYLPEEYTLSGCKSLEVTEAKEFNYITGSGSPFDYWHIKVETEEGIFETKSNFYCSVKDSDDGNVLIVIIMGKSGGNAYFYFSDSSSCSVGLN